MVQKPIILFLSSTSLHFPLDLHAQLVSEGQEAKRIDQLDELFSSPDRHRPYLAVLEIGSTDDLERAMLAAEWCEKIQPIAPCRLLLLVASKNIVLGDRAQRFGSAEVAYLPMPFKNLVFKVDLQKKLLTTDHAKAAPGKKSSTGFSTRFIEKPPSNERVLLARGPGPKQGFWQEAGESPQGKIRWRWVKTPDAEKEKEEPIAEISWVAESKVIPEFMETEDAWTIDDPEAELQGFKKDNKPIFSARAADAAERALAKTAQPPAERTTGKIILTAEAARLEKDKKFAQDLADKEKKSRDTKKEAKEEITGKIIYAEGQDPKNPAKAKPGAAPVSAHAVPAKPASVPSPAPASVIPVQSPASAQKPASVEAPWNQASQKPKPTEQEKSPPLEQLAIKKNPEWTKPSITVTPDETQAPKNFEQPIPETRHEEEKRDTSGYSVAVPTGGRTNVGADPKALDDEIFSHQPLEIPQTEAEYLSQIERARAKNEERARVESEKKVALQTSSVQAKDSEKLALGKPPQLRESTSPPAHNHRVSPQAKARPEAPTQKQSESAGISEPRAKGSVVNSLRSGEERAAENKEEQQSRAGDIRATSANQSVKGNSSEQDQGRITVGGDAGPVAPNSKIAISGETARSGEEIRIRAGVMAERAASSSRKTAEVENYLKYRHFVTMTLEELNDRDSSWHPVERYRIYLSASSRYYGVKDPNALLPLWVYEGELAPEFLEDKQAWKFYDRYPELYSALDTLPPPVLDHVYRSAGIEPPKESKSRFSAKDSTKNWQTAKPSSSAQYPEKQTAPRPGVWGGVIGFIKRIFGG